MPFFFDCKCTLLPSSTHEAARDRENSRLAVYWLLFIRSWRKTAFEGHPKVFFCKNVIVWLTKRIRTSLSSKLVFFQSKNKMNKYVGTYTVDEHVYVCVHAMAGACITTSSNDYKFARSCIINRPGILQTKWKTCERVMQVTQKRTIFSFLFFFILLTCVSFPGL